MHDSAYFIVIKIKAEMPDDIGNNPPVKRKRRIKSAVDVEGNGLYVRKHIG